MLTQTQEHILELLLSNQEEQFSIRHVSRVLGKSYALTYNNIQDLVRKHILQTYSLPPAQIISLSNDIQPFFLIPIEQKKAKTFLEKYSWADLYMHDVLQAAPHPFFILLVFGSYAKQKVTAKSDIDLLAIVPSKQEIPLLEQTLGHYTPVKKNIVIVDTQNFLNMIKNPKAFNIGNEARKHHIILYGAESYYQLLETRS
mgnify:CR=1 FL=1